MGGSGADGRAAPPQVCPLSLPLQIKATHLLHCAPGSEEHVSSCENHRDERNTEVVQIQEPHEQPLVSSHPAFPWTPSGMGNSLPYELFCSSKGNFPAVWEWEQSALTLSVCLWRWLEKYGFFSEVPDGTEVHSQPRILPASSCLPFTMDACDLTSGEGPVYGIWWLLGKCDSFSTYTDGWPLSSEVPQTPSCWDMGTAP